MNDCKNCVHYPVCLTWHEILHEEGLLPAIMTNMADECEHYKTLVQGHWIESKCLDDCFWVCSECDFPSEALGAPVLYKYCPNCGAKMEGATI